MYLHVCNTGAPPITLFFGPGKIHRVIGKTVLKEDRFSTKHTDPVCIEGSQNCLDPALHQIDSNLHNISLT